MEIKRNKRLRVEQFLSESTFKSNIILHHTAGSSADSAINWWNQTKQRVATPYVIDRDGTIYETFNPAKWAYHLGLGIDHPMEKSSIGIELVACGHLYKRKGDGKYFFMPLYPNKTVKTWIPEDEVVVLDKEFRGHKFYHKYTEAQIESLMWLLGYLCDMYCITPQKYFPKSLKYNPKVAEENKEGIWAHSIVREDKRDIFPQNDLLKKLSSTMRSIRARIK